MITTWSIRALADAVAARRLSPVELAEAFLDRVVRSDPVIGAFVHIDPELVLRQAKQAEAEAAAGRVRGPLHGLPVGVKDLIDTADMPTRYGSPRWADHRPSQDAAVVRRLRAAGAVVFGKNTTQEFAVGVACAPTVNPWNPDRVAGGSSGGSAAAVADLQCVASVGSDTGGSIRLPASFCGVAGLRPTGGVLPTDGVWPASRTLDRVGPIARTVRDVEVLLRCLAGNDLAGNDLAGNGLAGGDLAGGDRDPVPPRGLRIGMVTDWFTASDDDVRTATLDAVRALESAGVELVELAAPAEDLVPQVYGGVALAELAEVHGASAAAGQLAHNPELLDAVSVGQRMVGGKATEARAALAEIGRAWDALFTRHRVEAVVSPTVPFVACPPDDLPSVAMRIGDFTIPVSLSGLPALSQPVAFASGLPVGLQWIGPRDGDLRLLALGRMAEEVIGETPRLPAGAD